MSGSSTPLLNDLPISPTNSSISCCISERSTNAPFSRSRKSPSACTVPAFRSRRSECDPFGVLPETCLGNGVRVGIFGYSTQSIIGQLNSTPTNYAFMCEAGAACKSRPTLARVTRLLGGLLRLAATLGRCRLQCTRFTRLHVVTATTHFLQNTRLHDLLLERLESPIDFVSLVKLYFNHLLLPEKGGTVMVVPGGNQQRRAGLENRDRPFALMQVRQETEINGQA